MKTKFLRCSRCGQIIAVVNNTNLPVMCCMADMIELVPNTVDASFEKHVPVFKKNGNEVAVNIGSEDHPMESIHYIQWIAIATDKGVTIKHLNAGDKPCATFNITTGETLEGIYAYCNQHGLWAVEI